MPDPMRNRWRLLLPALLCLPLAGVAQEISLQYTEVSPFTKITDIRHAGDGSGRLFLASQPGFIYIIKNGSQLPEPFLDISDRTNPDGERGLLSLAFAPDYASSGWFYLWYTNLDDDTVLARYRVSADNPDRADPDSRQTLLTLAQPAGNHNGGRVLFGVDGYLYLSIGDGGGSNDRFMHGQNIDTLFGSIVRLDVSSGERDYAIPPDNPLVGKAGADELWAWGLRNPWRIAFDPLNHDLFIADVGQNAREEVNVQAWLDGGGRNYGWPIREGSACLGGGGCTSAGLTGPVAEYDRADGCSITGGEVYRGSAYPQLWGMYLYGDFCSGKIWSLRRSETGWEHRLLDDSNLRITTFGRGEDGSIYIGTSNQGVFRLSDGPAQAELPFQLNAGLNDAWARPGLEGQGLMVSMLPGLQRLFMAWFTFDLVRPGEEPVALLGEPGHRWLTAFGPTIGNSARLQATLTSGAVFDSSEPVPADEDYGSILLSFSDCRRGMVTYDFPAAGVAGQFPIQRVSADNLPLCEALSAVSHASTTGHRPARSRARP